MTQKGLLLSLLHQILRQASELIPSISPTRWEALCLFGDDNRELTEAELHQMLRSVIKVLSDSSRICLLADGLDEFNGSHEDLICLFKELIVNPNTKVCVSSRPWVVFEDEFKHKPSLKLQDLTYPDIKLYVSSHLYDNPGFVQLSQGEPAYAAQLADNIIDKASGVFLWVHLVVASLLAGMGYADRVSDLQRRLESLPPDLQLLYKKILLSLDPFYLEHAAQLFKLVQESLDPPSLLLLSFADEEDPRIAVTYPTQTLSDEQILLRSDTMRRRLNSRCKGLLEVGSAGNVVQSSGDLMVQYLHRTVKDYIESEEAQLTLQSALKAPFDPHLRLCVGNLMHIKVIDGTSDFLTDGAFWARVQRCLYSASRILATHSASIVACLDELDRTGSFLVKQLSQFEDAFPYLRTDRGERLASLLGAGLWVASNPLCRKEIGEGFGGTFLGLAVRYGVLEFVEKRANYGCLVQSPLYDYGVSFIWPLLADAVDVMSSSRTEHYNTLRQPDMITCLLKKDADPNSSIPGEAKSVWDKTLDVVLENYDISLKAPWLNVAHEMIDHGAKLNKDFLPNLLAPEETIKVSEVINGEELPPSDLPSSELMRRGWCLSKEHQRDIHKWFQLFNELSAIQSALEKAKSPPKTKPSWSFWA